MKVPEDKLRTLLGTASVTFKPGEQRLAIIDTPLQSWDAPGGVPTLAAELQRRRSPSSSVSVRTRLSLALSPVLPGLVAT